MTFSSLARVAHDGSTLMVSYTGTLDNGQQFASGIKNFTLGAGQVIKGWDQGLVGMKVGQTRDLSISPQDGYGASGNPMGGIPPNAQLNFKVKLDAIM